MSIVLRAVLWLFVTAVYIDGATSLYHSYRIGHLPSSDVLPAVLIVLMSLGCLIYQWARIVRAVARSR